MAMTLIELFDKGSLSNYRVGGKSISWDHRQVNLRPFLFNEPFCAMNQGTIADIKRGTLV
jgi:hypothetical protein